MLENEYIRLRAVEPEDLDALYRWENDFSLWLVGDMNTPYSRYTLREYILQTKSDIYEDKQLRLMIESKSDKAPIGTVDLFNFDMHNSRIALGLYIDADFRGKAYATKALKLIEDYVFRFLKINQLYVHIAVSNVPTVRMFEKENYIKSGVLKQWIRGINDFEDVIVFQKMRERV